MEQEVDVKLFITCRLCLGEPGSFQIVPNVQKQINYCFGIDIDPFDGLPQLICKKCKSILTEYYSVKSQFVEKQQDLQANLTKDLSQKSPVAAKVPARGDSVTSQDAATEVNDTGNTAASGVAPPSNIVNTGKSRRRKSSWKKEFNKHFVCTICSKQYLTEKSIKKHTTTTHKRLTGRHEKIFKSYVTVRMNKIDKKLNSTGCLQSVVYNKDKIISDRVNSNYYTFYSRKLSKELCNNENHTNENVPLRELGASSDCSDDEIIADKKKRTRRLFSTSSTQTVILEESKEQCNNTVPADNQSDPNETETIQGECINLDETSSECPPRNSSDLGKTRTLSIRQQPKPKVADYKAIQSIVTMCHKNYIKKINSDETTKCRFSESSLKHKVLSLGRKVINKQGFSCTGLLRYMEHKDLDITWTPTSSAVQNKGSNFVRIMTKLKSRDDSENEDAGWKNVNDLSFCRENGVERNTCGTILSENETVGGAAIASPPLALDQYDDDLNQKNKLLNKTPVANPKQLPKKNNIFEVKPETTSVIIRTQDATVLASVTVSDKCEGQVDDSNMCLPIITSTTSLSCPSGKEKQEVSEVDKPAPRIKVKPVSELMPERALSNQETTNDIWAFNMSQCTLPRHFTNVTVNATPTSVLESETGVSTPTSGNLPSVICNNDTQLVVEPNRDSEKSRNDEYVTLNCPDLPNTRTKSPFYYFKTVLHVHGLKLLDLNDDLPQRFHCLIKFQLLLEQDSKKPIKVLFSLFCSKTTFCFAFKDAFLKTFDPNKLPAFWQWELLKVYKGDVIDKILQNALKIGKEIYDSTNHFLCLLKSIDLIES